MAETKNISQPISPLSNKLEGKWPSVDTAILIIHGIGHQNPIETLDQFTRTLAETLQSYGKHELRISHQLAKKLRSNGSDSWFDNYLQIQRIENGHPIGCSIDVYEYYWANYTEDQASLTDIAGWVNNVTNGAKRFYKESKEMGETYGDKSLFFRNGKFLHWRYNLFIYFICGLLPALSFFSEQFLKLFSYIPLIGIPFRSLFTGFANTKLKYLANVVGDITVYNTTDQKCKFYRVRQEILTGAVNSILYLIQNTPERNKTYGKVLVSGHSLGTQIGYDAINRLIHLANSGEIKGYEAQPSNLNKVLCGFITFGSPLDKIAFFLRETVPNQQYLRVQVLKNFHAFKQRDWTLSSSINWKFRIEPVFKRILEDIPWKNYYDRRDYVSGSLDYYKNLVNIDCRFDSRFYSFTHSKYWDSTEMFADILDDFVLK